MDENTVANTDADQPIGDPLRATDADSADTLTYSLDTAGEAFFDIDSATGQLRTKVELDHEARKSYSVNVSVSDGKDANDAANPSTDNTITVTVLVSDVNEAPSFGSVDPTRTIAENTPAGEPLGAPFQATDGDGDTLTYSLAGTARRTSRSTRPPASCGPGQPWTTRRRPRIGWPLPPRTRPGAFDEVSVMVTVDDVEEPGAVSRGDCRARCRACSPGLATRCSPT